MNLKKLLFILGIGYLSFSCNLKNKKDSTTLNVADKIAHGAYLVTIMGCNDCHSPKQAGANGPEIIKDRMLSGFPSDRPIAPIQNPLTSEGFAMFYPDLTAAIGPWGTSFAGNLTPDESGIGNWSEDQFIYAMTKGKLKGLENGRPILPPMPVENYINMKKEDLQAIFSYLQSIPPVFNVVPSHIPPG